jgi:ketosteroid isomerase-like protein
MPTAHEVFNARYVKAMNERNYDEYEALLTEDFVGEYPQSGEVIHGAKNARAIVEQYPGRLPEGTIDTQSARIAATDARWLKTPAFTFVRAEGTGNVGVSAVRTRYPDGSLWWVVNFYELRDGRLARSTTFFAPAFEAPEWRQAFVEPRRTPAER